MRKRTLALLALAGLVVLAGCSGETTETTIETDGSDTPTETETQTPDKTTSKPAETTSDSGETSTPVQIDTATLQADTIEAMSDVVSYRMAQNVTTVQMTNNQEVTTNIEIEYAANRDAKALESHRTVTQLGTETVIDTYLSDERLYQRSDQYVQRYGSEWVTENVSENFTQQFNLRDQLWRYEFTLDSASLSSVEATTVDGTETYRVAADVNTTKLNDAIRSSLNLSANASQAVSAGTNVTSTFWIDTETKRPLRVDRTVIGTQTIQGQPVDFERTITTELSYEEVTVTLPDGANSAVSLNSTAS
ncbi:membrane lipoprotein [Halorhabdus tiamatea SARL4B]|uniref:Membrane lipoprotein n=1 Tax=Halorhabdus tiamatea SARL4B TaxID=1033806 RepID=F7PH78_9EURY|nr:hypothetical protein [Halorhabdus tiamatea]ERJ05618.1 membrane lipoprotein [Halorhabdus tiamatea SARL4B]CCQ32495.1 conserved hypothetical protein [Halorhabdus tiamatea SARL4B]